MIAICPVGPPNEMKPSLSQKRNASPNVGRATTGLPCRPARGFSIRLSKVLHKMRETSPRTQSCPKHALRLQGDLGETLQNRQKNIVFLASTVLCSAKCFPKISASACPQSWQVDSFFCPRR